MSRRTERDYAMELARAAGGAVLFAFPLLMTMEMWWLGFYMDRLRLALFLAADLALLFALSRQAGFEAGTSWREDLMDALSAFGVGVIVSAVLLLVFRVIDATTTFDVALGMIALQAIPAGIGAILARRQFQAAEADGQGDDGQGDDGRGDDDVGEKESDGPDARDPAAPTHAGELVVMAGGAVFVAFNVAPTEEVALIAHQMTSWHAVLLAVLSLVLMHALVYGLGFAGQEPWPKHLSGPVVFYRYTLTGYGLALAIGFYVLWTFGRLDGTGLGEIAELTVVMGFPAALGAATARLVV